jgi:Methyltransferase domain
MLRSGTSELPPDVRCNPPWHLLTIELHRSVLFAIPKAPEIVMSALTHFLPRTLQRSIELRHEMAQLARLPAATLDSTPLRSAIPDYTRFSDEWPEVERVMTAVGLADPRGGVNRGDRRLIYQLVRALAPSAVLEVGTHVGASTLMLALALARTGGTLTTVDIADVNAPDAYWKRNGCKQSPLATLSRAGVSANFHQSDSVAWLRDDPARYDLIFLDGLHEAQQLYRELPLALTHLNAGGLILLHDVFPDLQPLWGDGSVIPGPWLALERYAEEHAPIKVKPLGTLPWGTKQGSNVTSLAVVLR